MDGRLVDIWALGRPLTKIVSFAARAPMDGQLVDNTDETRFCACDRIVVAQQLLVSESIYSLRDQVAERILTTRRQLKSFLPCPIDSGAG